MACAAVCDDTCEAAGQPKDAGLDNNVVGTGPDLGDGSSCPVPWVPTVEQYEKAFSGWLPATSNPHACSETDIGTLRADIDGTATFSDISASLSAPCATCLFTVTDAMGSDGG